MSDAKEPYWSKPGLFGKTGEAPIMAFRTHLALVLIEKWGTVAARIDGESSDGRSKLALQEPKELIDRCFAIADAYVDEAERRGEIRMFTHLDMEEEVEAEEARIEERRRARQAAREAKPQSTTETVQK